MKTKILIPIGTLGVVLIIGNAGACPIPYCPEATYNSTCTASSMCDGCRGTTSTTNDGLITTVTKEWVISGSGECPAPGGTYGCYCNTTTTYECAAGYYGYPTSASSTCSKCPDGTWSARGTQTVGGCVSGGNTDVGDVLDITICPTMSNVWTDVETGYQAMYSQLSNPKLGLPCKVRCAPGYYGTATWTPETATLSGCAKCPTSGGIAASSEAGSTDITNCYIPAGTSFTGSTGIWSYTSNCYWTD